MYSIILLPIVVTIFLHGFFLAGVAQASKAKASSGLWNTLDKKQPVLFAHRGEKILMPEHTKGAYELAALEYVDYVEPDLLLTKDGHVVCYHDVTLKSKTDVASRPEFAYLMKNWTGIVDETNIPMTFVNDWFVRDFLLADLQTLFVQQQVIGIRPQLFNNFFHIPTFQEYLDIIHKVAFQSKRSIGIIPEIKNPIFHNANRTPHYHEDKVLNILKLNGYPMRKNSLPKCVYINSKKSSNSSVVEKITCGHVIIQCFDRDPLRYVKTQTDVDLMLLLDDAHPERLTYGGLSEVAKDFQYFCIWKELYYTGVIDFMRSENLTYDRKLIASLGGFIPPHELVKVGHSLKLKMALYVIYDSHEPSLRGCAIKCDPENKQQEMFYYFALGVDGLFVENIQEAIDLRMKYDCILHPNSFCGKVLPSIGAQSTQNLGFGSNQTVWGWGWAGSQVNRSEFMMGWSEYRETKSEWVGR